MRLLKTSQLRFSSAIGIATGMLSVLIFSAPEGGAMSTLLQFAAGGSIGFCLTAAKSMITNAGRAGSED